MRIWLQIALALALLAGARLIPSIAERMGVAVAAAELGFAALYVSTFGILYGLSGESRPPLGRISVKGIAIAIAAGLSLFVLGMLAYAGTFAVYSRMGWDLPDALSFFDVHGIFETTALVLFIMGMVLLEEYTFRGIILHGMRDRLSASGAILVSSICFSLYHLSGFQIPATFIWGLGLGILFVRTNSLLAPVVAHLTFNLLSVGLFLSGAMPQQ